MAVRWGVSALTACAPPPTSRRVADACAPFAFSAAQSALARAASRNLSFLLLRFPLSPPFASRAGLGLLVRLEAGDSFADERELVPLFDQPKVRRAAGADEAEGDARFARAPRAADAMHVVHRRTRQIIVDDRAQADDIEAARRQIRRHQHPDALAFQIRERLRAGTVTHSAVQRRRGEAGLHELTGDVLGAVLTGQEHQHARPSVLVE